MNMPAGVNLFLDKFTYSHVGLKDVNKTKAEWKPR